MRKPSFISGIAHPDKQVGCQPYLHLNVHVVSHELLNKKARSAGSKQRAGKASHCGWQGVLICLALAGCGQAVETTANLDVLAREAQADYLRAVQQCQASAFEFGYADQVSVDCRESLETHRLIRDSLLKSIAERKREIGHE